MKKFWNDNLVGVSFLTRQQRRVSEKNDFESQNTGQQFIQPHFVYCLELLLCMCFSQQTLNFFGKRAITSTAATAISTFMINFSWQSCALHIMDIQLWGLVKSFHVSESLGFQNIIVFYVDSEINMLHLILTQSRLFY